MEFIDYFFLKYCNLWGNAQNILRFFLSLRVHTFVEINENFAKMVKILSFVDTNEKNTYPWKKKKILPVKRNILPVKEYKNSASEKKSVREKNRKKCAWKTLFAPEKIQKTQKNGFHGHFFFHGEKK